ncbi:MAG: helix-hairpin-helix domain-containing protein [Candidatus Scalindua sp.]|nr:helix-hairpin-helix domain-containing protein [Candidatus Scalindua sp.]
MDVIRKVAVILVFAALVSFVSNLADAEHSAKVNINTATVKELKSLKGIGKKKAKSIVKYREEFGSFASIDDLKGVKGIGDKVFNKIRDHIAIE